MNFNPAAANNGTNNFLALYNAYNRVSITAVSEDNTSSWSYSTATWRAADNSTSNRITYIDGLQQSGIVATESVVASLSNSSGEASINLDSTSATPKSSGVAFTAATSGFDGQPTNTQLFLPSLGLHFLQAMEDVSFGSVSFIGLVATGIQGQSLVVTVGGM